MCGIAGKISFGDRPSDGLADCFLDNLDNRGPDDSGVYASRDAVLAHRRLSVIDPTQAGQQPMSNPDGSVHIVFNGEIYNYRELRERVSHYPFKSETDTEVLLALYEEYGTDCLDLLRGMFAFGIWDENKRRLFLARDRLGQKPLFYRRDGDTVWFASTIRAITSDEAVPVAPDTTAIRQYLNYQYVPAPRTGFETIEQLRPAECVVVRDGAARRERYWTLSFSEKSDLSPSRLSQRLRSLLEDSVRLRLRSDVPLGVFLSGGIDSTVVTALAARISDTPVRTFSVGFEDDATDDRHFANVVADQYDTDHHEFTVKSGAIDPLRDIVKHVEMPFGDPSVLPTYHVSRMASNHTTVALTGDAGDENFAGYDRYGWDRLASTARRAPRAVRTGLRRTLDDTPGLTKRQFARHGSRFLSATLRDPVGQYATFICHAMDDQVGTVWNGPSNDSSVESLRMAFERADGPTRLDRVQHVDFETYLPDDLLTKVDRASMAHSMEVRSPFLDHKLVEFAARIPARYKYRRGTKKWILKRSCRDLLPEGVADRSKEGFGIPVHEWFRGSLRETARRRLTRLGAREQFERQGLLSALERHVDRREDLGHHLWDLLVLELWYEEFFDAD
jgi:asparagine synthase (glutamine-hydrolysing)